VSPKVKIMPLRAWRRLTNRMRLRMAIAEKRSLGTWCKWIGILQSVGGVLFFNESGVVF
jgi:hypothetical protein